MAVIQISLSKTRPGFSLLQESPRINDDQKRGRIFDVFVLQTLSKLDMRQMVPAAGRRYADVLAKYLNGMSFLHNKFTVLRSKTKIAVKCENSGTYHMRYKHIEILSPDSNKKRQWIVRAGGKHNNDIVSVGDKLDLNSLITVLRTIIDAELPSDERTGDSVLEEVIYEFDKRKSKGSKIPNSVYNYAGTQETEIITSRQDGMSIEEIADMIIKQS